MAERFAFGEVYLIGGGPGDPGLLTLRGKEVLGSADVVVYDPSVDPDLLRHAGKGARRVPAWKQGRAGPSSREGIARLLLRYARRGKRVVRLMGGDPFLGVRGVAEAEFLSRAGVPFQVVPGVSPALAVPAYAGIPLADPGRPFGVAILTGRGVPGRVRGSHPWRRIAGSAETIVIPAGTRDLRRFLRGLLREGVPPSTPIAVIRRGTRPGQEVVTARLDRIEDRLRGAATRAPALLVAGRAVLHRDRLQWFERRPLHGLRVLVTRAREQAGPLTRELENHGADVIQVPMIEIRPPADWRPFDRALARLRDYDWIVFTSANGVRFALGRILQRKMDARALHGVRLAAIGPETEGALLSRGLRADRIPGAFLSEGLLRAFRRGETAGRRFLLPRGDLAGDLLPRKLRERGARVDPVVVYRTVRPAGLGGIVRKETLAGGIDMITFTSPSTVNHFVKFVAPRKASAVLRRATVACIGPVTAGAAEEHGIRSDIVSGVHTVPGLVASIVDHFRARGTPSGPR